MKHFALLLVCLFLVNCKLTEKPEFVEMNNLDITNRGITKLNVSADAVFFNPNDIGYELVSTDIEVFVNEQSIGKAKQPRSVEILANENFTIPLTIDFSLSDLNLNVKSLLKGITGSIIDQKVNIEFKGDVTLKKAGVPFTIPMVYSQQIDL